MAGPSLQASDALCIYRGVRPRPRRAINSGQTETVLVFHRRPDTGRPVGLNKETMAGSPWRVKHAIFVNISILAIRIRLRLRMLKTKTLDSRLKMSGMTGKKLQIPRYARNDNAGVLVRMTAPPHPCPLPRGKGGKRHEMPRLRKTGEIKTLDSLLDWIHSLIGSPIRSGTSVENDRKGKADSSLRSE